MIKSFFLNLIYVTILIGNQKNDYYVSIFTVFIQF